MLLMVPTTSTPRELMDTSASSPRASLGTRASDTETATSIRSTPSITATGAEAETNPPSAAFREMMVPSMGAMTLPLASTFSSTDPSCSTLDL